MANKREFKKYVDTICNNLISEMTTACYLYDGIDVKQVDDAIVGLLRAGADALIKSNIKFDKIRGAFDNNHEYLAARNRFFREMYARINTEFTGAVTDAVHKFNVACPEEIRNQAKQHS